MKSRVMEHALEISSDRLLISGIEAKDAAPIDMDARHACDEMHWRSQPCAMTSPAEVAAGSAAAATVAAAPPAAPVSHRLSQGRHPSGVFERVPKRATCCRPGNVTPAGSSRSGVSCET